MISRLRTVRLGPLQGVGLFGTIGVVLIFLAISVTQYGQPYVIDEAVFPYVADGILTNGAPIFYNGETRPMDVGLWHPPLYDYLLALQYLIWGVSPFAVRSFGAICVVLAFFFLALALRRIAPDMKQYGYVVMAALFLLNPLVISDALVPDIDGTLGVLLVTMALWIATHVAQRPLSWRLVLGVFAFATFAVSTKFIVAGIVAGIIGCSALIAPVQRWMKVLWVVVAFAAATAVSLSLLMALGALLGFDARGPFDYLFGSLGSRSPGRSGLEGTIANFAGGPGSNLVWIGPAIIASAIAALVIILVRKPEGVNRRLAALLVGISIGIAVGYSYITASPYSFPKYTAIVVPGLALVVSLLVMLIPAGFRLRSTRSVVATRLITVAAVAVLAVGAAGVLFLAARFERLNPRASSELIYLSLGAVVGVILVVAVYILLVRGTGSLAGLQRLRRPLAVGAVAALVLVPIMVQTSSSIVNAASPFATRYYYREQGMSEFLTSVKEIVPPGAEVIAPKDVGLQIDRPFWEDAAYFPLTPDALRDKLEQIDAPYLVTRSLWDYSESVYPDQFDVLREFYEPILPARPGVDFTLWELK